MNDYDNSRSLKDLDDSLAEAGVSAEQDGTRASFALALARQVLAVRQHRGWTQAQLAERAEMSQQQIADIERLIANPTLTTLDRLFTAMDLPKGFLAAS